MIFFWGANCAEEYLRAPLNILSKLKFADVFAGIAVYQESCTGRRQRPLPGHPGSGPFKRHGGRNESRCGGGCFHSSLNGVVLKGLRVELLNKFWGKGIDVESSLLSLEL